jgi:hypothetical protein
VQQFKDKIEILSYLREKQVLLQNIRFNESDRVRSYLIPIFASPVTDDKVVMTDIQNWMNMNTGQITFTECVIHNVEMLYDVDLNPFKLGILARLRGVQTERDLIEFSLKNFVSATVVRHKDFPVEVKIAQFKLTGDITLLPLYMQDLFGF